jgi:glycerol uptake facilitator-like aquaporin
VSTPSYQIASLIAFFLAGLLFLFLGENAFRSHRLHLLDPSTPWGKRTTVEGKPAVIAGILLLALGTFFLLISIMAFFLLPFFTLGGA